MHPALAALPHGPSFRFVDHLRSLDPGVAGVGEYRLQGTEAFLAGHFPGAPLLPGVLLVEAVAQLGGVVAQSDPNVPPLAELRLTAIAQAKIFGSAVPGELLTLHAKVLGRSAGLVLIEGSASVVRADAEVLVLSTRLTLSGIANG